MTGSVDGSDEKELSVLDELFRDRSESLGEVDGDGREHK